MLTRREMMERVDARLRARSSSEKGEDDSGIEASRCFLRAMLVGIEDAAPVPDALVSRVSEFLKIDVEDLVGTSALRRASTRPPPSSVSLQAPPGERRRRVLFLGRSDAARIPMVDAVARTQLADEVEIRAAAIAPVAFDARALRVLRHAGYATDVLGPRALTVDDLSWADVVVTISGEREDWERFLPRTLPHQHEAVDDPIALMRAAKEGRISEVDELEPFRGVLRAVERLLATMRPPRSSRMPAAPPSVRPPRLGSLRAPPAPRFDPADLEDPPPNAPSSGKVRAR